MANLLTAGCRNGSLREILLEDRRGYDVSIAGHEICRCNASAETGRTVVPGQVERDHFLS